MEDGTNFQNLNNSLWRHKQKQKNTLATTAKGEGKERKTTFHMMKERGVVCKGERRVTIHDRKKS